MSGTNNGSNDGFKWLLYGVIGLIAVYAASMEPALLPMYIIIGAIWYAYRQSVLPNRDVNSQYKNSYDQSDDYGYDKYDYSKTANTNEVARIRRLAENAMQQAGRDRNESALKLDDVGLLVYEGTPQPKIARSTDIVTTATHLRPFMVISQPNMRGVSGHGIITFNMRDEHNELRYTNSSRYQLHPGQNFITPPTWLPLVNQHTDQINGEWTIDVVIGESSLFAVHHFGWLPVGGEFRAQFNGDGEIDELALKMMSRRAASEQLSLDELLEEQVEEAPLNIRSQTVNSQQGR